MNAIGKYLLFIAFLVASVVVATGTGLRYTQLFAGHAEAGRHPSGEIPSLPDSPSYALTGLSGAGGIDYRQADNLTATGEEGRIRLWRLPDRKPHLDIDAGEGLLVTQVRFTPGKNAVAGCGINADGAGSVRIFSAAEGKEIGRIEDKESILSIDFDQSGRYLIYTGQNTIKVWDFSEGRIVSAFPRNSVGAQGLFFQEDRFILQSDSFTLHDWKNGKKVAGYEDIGAAGIKKINQRIYAWVGANGLHTIRTPYGKREFIPFDAGGVYDFALSPDGRWGLFLKENGTMAMMDCSTGVAVSTVSLKLRPESVFINQDGSSAFLLYGADRIDVYEIGNENLFRNAGFYTARFFDRMRVSILEAANGLSRVIRTSAPNERT